MNDFTPSLDDVTNHTNTAKLLGTCGPTMHARRHLLLFGLMWVPVAVSMSSLNNVNFVEGRMLEIDTTILIKDGGPLRQ